MPEIALGRTAAGEVVTISIRIDPAQNIDTGRTVEHEPIPEDALNLAIDGTVYDKRGRDVTGGQVVDYVREVVPNKHWTREDLDRLAAIWERWHLNELRAGCAHMDLPDDPRYDARKDITCPETGYRYGSAWLFERLPDDVLADARRFQRRLGYPGHRYSDYTR